MKQRIVIGTSMLAVVVLALFIINTVRQTARQYPPALSPELNSAPLVFYGQVQPAGKELRVGTGIAGIVQEVLVREGDSVHKGQPLIVLDNRIETAGYQVALSRIEYNRAAALISADDLKRKESLFGKGVVAEFDYVQIRLRQDLDQAQVAVSQREAELAAARLRERTITAPIDGIVYKCDLRPGEPFRPEDIARIILGAAILELRCDLEALWISRVDSAARYGVFHAETGDTLGTATFISASRYLRPKTVETENPAERLSAKYQEVIMLFVPDRPGLPIGLPVLVKMENRH